MIAVSDTVEHLMNFFNSISHCFCEISTVEFICTFEPVHQYHMFFDQSADRGFPMNISVRLVQARRNRFLICLFHRNS